MSGKGEKVISNCYGNFRERKAARKEYYLKFVYKHKQRPCISCSGTGYYDNTGSPKCGSCKGTGREYYKPEEKSKAVVDAINLLRKVKCSHNISIGYCNDCCVGCADKEVDQAIETLFGYLKRKEKER